MNPKQLANVLIKILGLSLIAHGIPGFLNGIIGWLQFAADIPLAGGRRGYSHYWLILALNLIPFAVGICLIACSRLLADKLFKDEPE